jgi:hypothetical protein
MAGRTILFKWTGAISLVATGTLLVKGIGTFWRLFIPFIGVVALTARPRVGILVLVKGMMTITA